LRIRLTKNLEPLRASALTRLNSSIGERLYDLTAAPVAMLRARKLADARAYFAGLGEAPLLTAEAFDRMIDVATMAGNIMIKAEEEAVMIAKIEGIRQRAQAAIRSAPTPAAIETALEAALEEILNG
jgi:hypothetical protein